MKIAHIEVFFIRYTYPQETLRYQFIEERPQVDVIDAAIVRVTSRERRIRHRRADLRPVPPTSRSSWLAAHFERLLKGHPITEITRAWDVMYRSSAFWNRAGLGIAVMGGINMAMYDLLGKTKGVPVHELLGGKVRAIAPASMRAMGFSRSRRASSPTSNGRARRVSMPISCGSPQRPRSSIT